MRPCDCKDLQDVKKLDHSGIKHNDIGIEVHPGSVIIERGPATLRIPQSHFERMARWYLEDQDDN